MKKKKPSASIRSKTKAKTSSSAKKKGAKSKVKSKKDFDAIFGGVEKNRMEFYGNSAVPVHGATLMCPYPATTVTMGPMGPHPCCC